MDKDVRMSFADNLSFSYRELPVCTADVEEKWGSSKQMTFYQLHGRGRKRLGVATYGKNVTP